MRNFSFFIFIFSLFSFIYCNSQTKIDLSLQYMREKKYEIAMIQIDKASKDPALKNLATTWYYKGEIYQAVYMIDESKLYTLDTAYKSLIKSMTLDPDQEYLKNIIIQLKLLSANYYRRGAIEFNNGKYAIAYQLFEKSVDINKSPMIMNSDSMVIYHAAVSAKLSSDTKNAKKHFNKLVNMKVVTLDVYDQLGDIYAAENDINNALSIYIEGLNNNCKDSEKLICKIIKLNLKYGKTQKAEYFITIGKEMFPANAEIYFYEANLFNLQLMDEKAIEAYKKGLEIEPDNFEANYNTGILNYNNAIIHKQAADKYKSTDLELYKQENSKYNKNIMEAVKYLEIAYSTKKNDTYLNNCLYDVYIRLNRKEQAEKLKSMLK